MPEFQNTVLIIGTVIIFLIGIKTLPCAINVDTVRYLNSSILGTHSQIFVSCFGFQHINHFVPSFVSDVASHGFLLQK